MPKEPQIEDKEGVITKRGTHQRVDRGRTKIPSKKLFFNGPRLENLDGHFSLNNSHKVPWFHFIFE
jgi:hypothetical protein